MSVSRLICRISDRWLLSLHLKRGFPGLTGGTFDKAPLITRWSRWEWVMYIKENLKRVGSKPRKIKVADQNTVLKIKETGNSYFDWKVGASAGKRVMNMSPLTVVVLKLILLQIIEALGIFIKLVSSCNGGLLLTPGVNLLDCWTHASVAKQKSCEIIKMCGQLTSLCWTFQRILFLWLCVLLHAHVHVHAHRRKYCNCN